MAAHGLLIAVTALVVEHRFSSWNLPRPGFKPMSPALAGRFLTAFRTSGKSFKFVFYVSESASVL